MNEIEKKRALPAIDDEQLRQVIGGGPGGSAFKPGFPGVVHEDGGFKPGNPMFDAGLPTGQRM